MEKTSPLESPNPYSYELAIHGLKKYPLLRERRGLTRRRPGLLASGRKGNLFIPGGMLESVSGLFSPRVAKPHNHLGTSTSPQMLVAKMMTRNTAAEAMSLARPESS